MDAKKDQKLSKVFGDNMRYLRLVRGWSQSEMARQMQGVPGWEKYSQVAVSRTEDGERIVRLDEGIAIARVLETTLDRMTLPRESHVAWIQELEKQGQLVVDAAKKLSDAARSYEDARSEALSNIEWITGRAQGQKAAKSLKDSLQKELDHLSHLANLRTYDLLYWLEDEQQKLDDEKYNDEM